MEYEVEQLLSEPYPTKYQYQQLILELSYLPAISENIINQIHILTSRAPVSTLENRAFAQILSLLHPQTTQALQQIINLELLTTDNDHKIISISLEKIPYKQQKNVFLAFLHLKKAQITSQITDFEQALFFAKQSLNNKILQQVYFNYGKFAFNNSHLKLANHCFKLTMKISADKKLSETALLYVQKICESAWKLRSGNSKSIRNFRHENEILQEKVGKLLKENGMAEIFTVRCVSVGQKKQPVQKVLRSVTPVTASVASSTYSTDTYHQKGVKKSPYRRQIVVDQNTTSIMDLANDFGISRDKIKEIFVKSQKQTERRLPEFKQSLLKNSSLKTYYVGVVDLLPLPQSNSLFYGDDMSIIGKKNVRCFAGKDEYRSAKDKPTQEVSYSKVFKEAADEYEQFVEF